MTNRGSIRDLIEDYNRRTGAYTDDQKRDLLNLALQYNLNYKPESKPFSKGLYDLLDVSTFGMLMPDSWEPHSIGQEYYDESISDRGAQQIGSLLGLGGSYGVSIAGAKGLGRLKDRIKSYFSKDRDTSQKLLMGSPRQDLLMSGNRVQPVTPQSSTMTPNPQDLLLQGRLGLPGRLGIEGRSVIPMPGRLGIEGSIPLPGMLGLLPYSGYNRPVSYTHLKLQTTPYV